MMHEHQSDPLITNSRPVRLRVSAVGLFLWEQEVLLLHQITLPELDHWDLPGGGVDPQETVLDALHREVYEETGITTFSVDRLLTVVDGFFQPTPDEILHTINVIYQCSLSHQVHEFMIDETEVGERGIQWLAIAHLTAEQCTQRTWKALQSAGLV